MGSRDFLCFSFYLKIISIFANDNYTLTLLIMKITKEAIFIILNIMLNIIRDTFLMMNKKDTNKYLI